MERDRDELDRAIERLDETARRTEEWRKARGIPRLAPCCHLDLLEKDAENDKGERD